MMTSPLAPIKELVPLDSQGRFWAYEPTLSADRRYPECPRHGAMNCVSQNLKLWRCLACEIGIEVVRHPPGTILPLEFWNCPLCTRGGGFGPDYRSAHLANVHGRNPE